MADAADTSNQINPSPRPFAAGDLRPHDHVVGAGTVRWLIAPMDAGVSPLLPNGGALITFTNDRQIGLPTRVEVMAYRATINDSDEPCPVRDSHGIGCMYRNGHDEAIFPHRFA